MGRRLPGSDAVRLGGDTGDSDSAATWDSSESSSYSDSDDRDGARYKKLSNTWRWKLPSQKRLSYRALIKATKELEQGLKKDINVILNKPVCLTFETLDLWRRYKASYGKVRAYTEAMHKVWSELKHFRDTTATNMITCVELEKKHSAEMLNPNGIQDGQKMLDENKELDKQIRAEYEQFHRKLPTSYMAKKK